MSEITVFYEGVLSTRSINGESNVEILTDAPEAAGGLGRLFSPTDLIAVALGSCALTLMGVAAKKLQIDLVGLKVVVSKEMHIGSIRRVKRIRLAFFCPKAFSETDTQALKKAAEGCPVHHSLHPEIVQEFIYHWGVE